MSSPAPLRLAEVLDPAWLSAALSRPDRPVEVTATEVTETLKTVATKVRFRVEYAGAAPDGLPDAFCVKGYFIAEDEDPGVPGAAAAGAVETRFYQELAPQLPVRTPACVYAASDPVTGHGIVIMHDLVAQGCTFLSALSPFSAEQASMTLDQLARLHAASWDSAAIGQPAWLDPRVATITSYVSVERLQELMDGPRREALPPEVTDARRMTDALLAVVGPRSADGECLIHGDAHAGNLYETPDAGPGVIDWQLVQRGHWALDVAYHVGAALAISDRERSERDLLRHYLDRLAHHGAQPPSFDQAWDDYRAAFAYGYFLWGITQRVQPDIIQEFVTRLGTAVSTHGSFELLGV
jgi:aminoglycoside phosphotransferase (APT) family kinase protein